MEIKEPEQELSLSEKYAKLKEGRSTKIYSVSKETMEFVRELFSKTTLEQFGLKLDFVGKTMKKVINFKALSPELVFNNGYEILVEVNEDLFLLLDEEYQKMVVENELNRVYFDSSKDKVKILPYEINVNKFMFTQYGQEKTLNFSALMNELKTMK